MNEYKMYNYYRKNGKMIDSKMSLFPWKTKKMN